ncbi:MAG: ABC transporter permease, partial [Rhodothermales bacterium]
MLAAYLKIALRNLRRHWAFAFINVAGLSVGMASCLLIFLYVRDELSYDRYHADADRIYRLALHVDGASFGNGIAKVADPWGPDAKAELPDVVAETRFVFLGRTLVERADRRQFETEGMYADSATFNIFSWPLIEGDPDNALVGPGKIVLTRSFAERWFGDEDPMGKTLLMDKDDVLTVSGVMEDVPSNSHFTFDFLVSLESYQHELRGDWVKWNQFYTYLLLAPSVRPALVATQVDKILDKHLEPETAAAYHAFLQPLTSIHLHSHLHREMSANSNVSYVYIFSTIALFILVIACANFVSLSTARSSRRAQEVGIRKVSGADRSMLVRQFLGESILICMAAVVLAWVLSFSVLDFFDGVSGKSFGPNALLGWPLATGLLIAACLIGAAAGLYPAVVLSAFRPVKVLKGDTGPGGARLLRKSLVVLQFTISACLLMATGVVYKQLDYIRNKDLGFNKDQVVIVSTNESATAKHYETIKQQLRRVPGVVNVSFSANRPGGSDWGIPVDFEGVPDEEELSPRMLC